MHKETAQIGQSPYHRHSANHAHYLARLDGKSKNGFEPSRQHNQNDQTQQNGSKVHHLAKLDRNDAMDNGDKANRRSKRHEKGRDRRRDRANDQNDQSNQNQNQNRIGSRVRSGAEVEEQDGDENQSNNNGNGSDNGSRNSTRNNGNNEQQTTEAEETDTKDCTNGNAKDKDCDVKLKWIRVPVTSANPYPDPLKAPKTMEAPLK